MRKHAKSAEGETSTIISCGVVLGDRDAFVIAAGEGQMLNARDCVA